MIEALAIPVTIATDFGTIALTHRAWGFTLQPWRPSPLMSYCVLGVVASDGAFKPYTSTEEYATIEAGDYAALLAPNAQGKKQDAFRNTDVIALHQAIQARAAQAMADQLALLAQAAPAGDTP